MKKVCLFVKESALLAVTSLVLLPVFAIASDQTEEPNPLATEPLEQYDNPPAPAPLWGTGISPGMISQEGPFTSHQVNVNASGQNITGDAANEPSISVDPTNHNRMVIGWRQFNSVTSNFRQSGFGYTSNGGTTWTFPGVLENDVFRSDPVLACDDTGRFLYLSLLETFFDNMWRSLNGGQTWTNLGPATGGDKQWFAIDNTNSSGHGFQYQIWSTAGNNYGGRQFSRSTDGGFTWMNPINIPSPIIWGTPDVDSNGNLFIGGVNGSVTRCIRSSNAKNGAVTPTFDQNTVVSLGGSIVTSTTINPGGLAGQLFLAADRSGTSTNNNVYILGSVQPTGFNTGTDVMFVRSTNGGLTFSTPKRVNDDPVNHNKWHWLGTLAVAPNGRIDSVWLDTRNAANNTDSQLFYSYSTDGGVTWSTNVAVSNSFNPFLGYPNQNKMGDYITIVSDNTGGDVAYTATFNLEEDIYYVRVSPSASTPTPTPTATATATATATPTATATATATATIVPTPTPGCGGTIFLAPRKDNTLYEDSNGQLSNGQGIYLFDGKTGGDLLRRGLIAFDLASIPANATVTGATLSMYLSQANGGPQAVSLSTVLGDWGEGASDAGDPGGGGAPAQAGDATWLHTFYNTSFWTTPGGDFSPTSSATTIVSALDTTYTWSGGGLVADVQAWVSNPASNFGWVIRGNEVTGGNAQRFNSRENSLNPPRLMVTYQAKCATPTPTPTAVSISGTVSYCSSPTLNPVPGATLTLTGGASDSTLSDGSGHYQFSSLAPGGSYTVTPTKAARIPGSAGINTVDVVAVQKHFLIIGTPLSGCHLAAADVNGAGGVNTVDVIAIQKFFLNIPGTANVGQYQFTPTSHSYVGLVSDQSAQDFDTLIFGDVVGPFADRLGGPSQDAAGDGIKR